MYTGEIINTYDIPIIPSDKDGKIAVDKDTLEWWINSQVRAFILQSILGNKESLSLKLGLQKFKNIIEENTLKCDNVYLWGNGINFDNTILKYHCDMNDVPYPIHYRNDRDIRTLLDAVDMAIGYSVNDIKQIVSDNFDDVIYNHDAICDAKYEAKMIHVCHSLLNCESKYSCKKS